MQSSFGNVIRSLETVCVPYTGYNADGLVPSLNSIESIAPEQKEKKVLSCDEIEGQIIDRRVFPLGALSRFFHFVSQKRKKK